MPTIGDSTGNSNGLPRSRVSGTTQPTEKTLLIALVILAPIVVVTVCVLVVFFVYRRRKPSSFNEVGHAGTTREWCRRE